MVRKIVDVKNPSLREISKPIHKIDKKILDLIRDMEDTLVAQNDPEGVGLAAPQIGKNLRAFVINYEGLKKVVINPEILTKTNTDKKQKGKKKNNDSLEGCLSLPHFYGPIKRADKIKIKYLDQNGKEIVEEFVDFQANIIQHEIDHLNGIIFIDHILEQKSPLYKFDGEEWEEVELI